MVKMCTIVSAVQRIALSLLVVMAFHSPLSASDVSSTDCSASQIQIAVDACIDSGGGTVHIPACASGETWQDGDSVKFDPGSTILRIKGAGKDNTVIGYVSGAGGTMFNHTGGTGFAELGDMTLLGNNYAGRGSALKSNDEGVDNLFIHDLKISDFGGYAVRLCTNGESPTVIANCDFENLRTYAIFVYGPADNSKWVLPAKFGVNNPNSVFIEDCTFIDVQGHHAAGFSGANITFRYNTITRNGTGIDGHAYGYGVGCGYGAANDIFGHYLYEMYNNNWTDSSTEYCIRVRSGTAMITDNSFNCRSAVTLVIEDQIIEGVVPDEVTGTDGQVYTAIWPHTSSADTRPVTGASWLNHWRLAGATGGAWTEETYYRPHCYEQSGCPQSDDAQYLASRDAAPDLCYSVPNQWWVWNNDHTYAGAGKKIIKGDEGSTTTSGCLRENHEYFLRAPQPGDPVESYTKYAYPHPMRADAGQSDDPDDNGSEPDSNSGSSSGSGCLIETLESVH